VAKPAEIKPAPQPKVSTADQAAKGMHVMSVDSLKPHAQQLPVLRLAVGIHWRNLVPSAQFTNCLDLPLVWLPYVPPDCHSASLLVQTCDETCGSGAREPWNLTLF
jgi:hypothetical protein